jgi:hypothetical protein
MFIRGVKWLGLFLFAGLVLASTYCVLRSVAANDPQGIWGQTTAAWVQALGAILAILVGFGIAFAQAQQASAKSIQDRKDSGRSAGLLALNALQRLADRLMVASRPHSKTVHGLALREHRTTEMVEALRQIDIGRLPPEIVVPLAMLRSCLFAINARITEIYRSEEEKGVSEVRRPARIKSSVRTYADALRSFAELREILRTRLQVDLPAFEQPAQLGQLVADVVAGGVHPMDDEELDPHPSS